MGRKPPGLPLSKLQHMWRMLRAPEPATSAHYAFLERFGFPPGIAYVECCGLDARGLPKFRVPAGRRVAR